MYNSCKWANLMRQGILYQSNLSVLLLKSQKVRKEPIGPTNLRHTYIYVTAGLAVGTKCQSATYDLSLCGLRVLEDIGTKSYTQKRQCVFLPNMLGLASSIRLYFHQRIASVYLALLSASVFFSSFSFSSHLSPYFR